MRDARGQPVADYVLVAFPEDPKLWVPQSRFVQTTRPNQNDTFSIKGLPPGRYLAAVVPSLETGLQNDPALLQQLRPQAQSFSLAEGQMLNLHLEMSEQERVSMRTKRLSGRKNATTTPKPELGEALGLVERAGSSAWWKATDAMVKAAT